MSNKHLCHWPSCRRTVSPRLWGCREHWFELPFAIRRDILRVYRPGQEIDRRTSSEYIAAAKAAQEWIKTRQPMATAPAAVPFNEPKEATA